MTYHAGTRIARIAGSLLLGTLHTTTAGAQVRPTTPDTTLTRTGAMPMANGAAMKMSGPHHTLAMAYGESLALFARAVHADASQSQAVNVALVRPATIEMRRSFDQMQVHHAAQMANAGTAMRAPMAADSAAGMTRSARRDSMGSPATRGGRRDTAATKPMTPSVRPDSAMDHTMAMPMNDSSSRTAGMGDMQSHMAGLAKHLGMLETEVNAPAPKAAQVIEHTAEILKLCAAAMGMPSDPMGKSRTPGTP